MNTLSAKNLSFTYDQISSQRKSKSVSKCNAEYTVKGIDVNFEPGHFYSILGPNGCGKTTLLDLLIGHLKPASGEIFIQNRDISLLSKLEIAKKIALVAQNYNVNFPFTVREVIMMGRHPYIKRFSQPSEKDVQRVNDVMRLTEIDLFASRKITDLSGGERQRCLFARALCQDTPFLFLDEAFSNMDIHHTIRLLDLVKREMQQEGRAVISVFHDINLASIWSDVLIFMKEGRVVACGSTDEVMDDVLIEDVFHVKPQVNYHPYSRAKQAAFRSENSSEHQ